MSLLDAILNQNLSTDEFNAAVQQFVKNGTFEEEIKKKNDLNQNILQLAAAANLDLEKFSLICKVLAETSEDTFCDLLTEKDSNGNTTLHQLVLSNCVGQLNDLFVKSKDNPKRIQALLKACNIKNNEGKTAYEVHDELQQNILQFAMKEMDCFEILCKDLVNNFALFEKVMNDPDDQGDTVLHQLVLFNRVNQLNYLFEQSKDNLDRKKALLKACNTTNNAGKMAYEVHDGLKQNILHFAMADLACFKILCDDLLNNIDLLGRLMQDPDDQGDTILHQMVQYKRWQALDYLLHVVANSSIPLQQAFKQAVELKNNQQETFVDFLKKNLNTPPRDLMLLDRVQAILNPVKRPESHPQEKAIIDIAKFDKALKELKITTDRLSQNETKAYKKVSTKAVNLYDFLKLVRDRFTQQNSTMTAVDFKDACLLAIQRVEGDIKEHRGLWFKHFGPVLRKILGVFSALTVVPAVIVAMTSRYGFIDTFFKTPKTNSQIALEKFQDELVHDIIAQPK